jgi:hypothetical protein
VPAPVPSALESVTPHALDAPAREHCRLNSHLLRRSLEDAAADAGVFALRVLTDTQDVHGLGPGGAKRRQNAGEEPNRAQVHVLVEALPNWEKQFPQTHVIWDSGKSDGAEVDRVVVGQDG